jgi:hypothetical protein
MPNLPRQTRDESVESCDETHSDPQKCVLLRRFAAQFPRESGVVARIPAFTLL